MVGFLVPIANIALKFVGWWLDYIQAKDQVKKNYLLFVDSLDKFRAETVAIGKSYRDQLERLRKELDSQNQSPKEGDQNESGNTRQSP